MKKISMILMAFALAMMMSQCKKNEGQTTSNNEVVTITLDVKQNNGSKVVVNPNTGTVDFETGDKIYVGSGGKYVGFLTHNGTNFSGNITNPTENQPLQFYFLGNVTPQETLSAGTTEECSVIISDQTEHLPVISCAASNENYVSGVTAYSAHLLNKCALVKFNVTTPSNAAICITGMKNKVTVDFTQNTMTPSQDGDGVIMLPAGSGENVEKWAILLPQEALEEGEEGTAYSEDGNYTGVRSAIPIISENDFLGDGIAFSINAFIIEGAVNGLFSVSETKQVYFSQGNLQYQASTNTWKFAEYQYDYIGDANQNISQTYSGWIDLFGWGTSGYHNPNDQHNLNYHPWSIATSGYGSTLNYYGYGPSINMPSPSLTGSSANYDWGVYNSICNAGNTANQWRTLTYGEWNYVFFNRTTVSGIRYAKAKVSNVNGVILLPDNWSNNTFELNNTNNIEIGYGSNNLTASQWTTLENAGAVFLPAAGYRNGTTTGNTAGVGGYYWTASTTYGNYTAACYLYFSDSYFYINDNWARYFGFSVRLVSNME